MYYPLVRRASLVRTDQGFHEHGNELVRKKELFDVARWNDAFTLVLPMTCDMLVTCDFFT
jgi:hypothetical protein